MTTFVCPTCDSSLGSYKSYFLHSHTHTHTLTHKLDEAENRTTRRDGKIKEKDRNVMPTLIKFDRYFHSDNSVYNSYAAQIFWFLFRFRPPTNWNQFKMFTSPKMCSVHWKCRVSTASEINLRTRFIDWSLTYVSNNRNTRPSEKVKIHTGRQICLKPRLSH